MRVALSVSLPLFGFSALFLATAVAGADADEVRGEVTPPLHMLPGIAEPYRQVTLAAPFDGVLMEVYVQEDSAVEQGELLALMDNRVALAAVNLAQVVAVRQAATERAETELEMAQRYLQRVMQAAEAASELEVDNARGNVQLAQVALREAREQARTAELQLALEQTRLATHELRAPFAGRILRVDGKPGHSMTRSDTVLTIADLTMLRVELQVPVAWYGRLVPRRRYELLAASPVEKVVPGKLLAVQPVIDAGTQTFCCVFEINNPEEQWPAGFAVKLVRPTPENQSVSDTNTTSTKHVFHSATLRSANDVLVVPRGGRLIGRPYPRTD